MSRRFVFRLQPVLDHRQRIEDEKKQTVALRQRACDDAQAELDRLNTEFREHSTLVRTRHQAFDAETLRAHYGHLHFLDRVIDAQIRVLAERRAALERARQDLMAAQKERKVVDKLKDRRRAAYAAEEMRIEQGELEDANARAYGRVQRIGGTP
jgi:flagellar FliJ protein